MFVNGTWFTSLSCAPCVLAAQVSPSELFRTLPGEGLVEPFDEDAHARGILQLAHHHLHHPKLNPDVARRFRVLL